MTKKIVFMLIAVGLSIAGMVATLEVGFRLAGFQPRVLEPPKPQLRKGKSGIWRGTVVQEYEIPVYYNQFGHREREFECENKPENVFRIIVLGDSYTEALQVIFDKTFHKIIERRLNKEYGSSGTVYEVISFGHSGYGQIRNEKTLRKQAIHCKPDLVLEEFNSTNDLFDDLPEFKARRLEDSKRNRVRKYSRKQMNERLLFIKGSMFNHFFAERLSDLYTDCPIVCKRRIPSSWLFFTDNTDAMHDKAWEIAKQSFVNKNELAKTVGAKYAMWLKSTRLRNMSWIDKLTYNYSDYQWDFDKPGRIAKEFLSKNGIPYVDVTPEMRKYLSVHGRKSLSFKYDGHWNEKGHAIAAEVIFEFLINEKLVSVEPSTSSTNSL